MKNEKIKRAYFKGQFVVSAHFMRFLLSLESNGGREFTAEQFNTYAITKDVPAKTLNRHTANLIKAFYNAGIIVLTEKYTPSTKTRYPQKVWSFKVLNAFI